MRLIPAVLTITALAGTLGCSGELPTDPFAVPEAGARSGLSAKQCVNVRGEGVMNIFNFAQPIALSGDLTGTTFPGLFTAQFTSHGAGGAMHGLFEQDVWETNLGSFTTSSNVLFAPADPPVLRWSGRFQITSGGSGFLVQQGTLNPETGQGELTYHGRICM